jgi:FkbM family methyltransferase
MKKFKKNIKLLNSFFKVIFFDNSDYKFSFFEKWQGIKFLHNDFQIPKSHIIEKNENLVKMKIKDFVFFVKPDVFKKGELSYIYSEVFLPEKINPHSYERDFIKIKENDVVIDAGACEGFFIKYALNKNAGKIYAFEPLGVLQEGLKATYENEINNHIVELYESGLSNISGESGINSAKDYICEAQIDNSATEKIKLISIDEFVIEKNIKKLDFIKMDIEGAEIDAIKGAVQTLKTLKPKLSIAVYHNYENANIIKELLLKYNPEYKVSFGGCFMFEKPFRPFMIYAY